MSEKPSNHIPSPRFSNGPSRNQQFSNRQPLYLQPNSPFMSPRSNRMSSPRNSGGSPDFIPLGVSSPVNRARIHWNRGNYSNHSSYSSPNSSNSSSLNYSNSFSSYKRHISRNFRGRNSFNYSGSNSPPIHLYYDKEALEDPWAALDEKIKNQQRSAPEKNTESTEDVLLDEESSSSEVSEDDDQ